ECFICEPLSAPYGARRDHGRKTKVDQSFQSLFMCANAKACLVLRKDGALGNPRPERQFIGDEDVRTERRDAGFQLAPLRMICREGFGPFYKRDAQRHHTPTRSSGFRKSLSPGFTS